MWIDFSRVQIFTVIMFKNCPEFSIVLEFAFNLVQLNETCSEN